MFKKAFQVALAFGVLAAGYAAYVRGFAMVAGAVGQASQSSPLTGKTSKSRTGRLATKLAVQCFGPGYWATAEDLQIRIYNAERKFWLYAREYKRSKDGRRLEFTPLAVIWQSSDGRSFKTATSDRATFDLDQPLGLAPKPGTSGNMRVVHARMEGDVRLRDDKGTPDPRDDLRITKLTYLEYDEAALQIASESDVVIEDNVYRILGQGFRINLRPKDEGPLPPGAATGFNGAQTAFLYKHVDITIRDVGPGGILPGDPKATRKPGEQTPLHLRCDGEMRVDLPAPRVQPRVGPPAPDGPTLAHFARNVEVVRGKVGQAPDQLDCDNLHLVLVPAAKGAAKVKTPPGPVDTRSGNGEDGPGPRGGDAMTELTLQRADASGHNVRLVSAAQGIMARGNELIHKKLMPAAADETYLRGDPTTRLKVEKEDVAQDGPDKGKVTSFTTIWTIDATIFDDGRGNDNATIVARGPGEMETRPGRNKPVERTAFWLDKLQIQSDARPAPKAASAAAVAVRAGAPAAAAPSARKKITLTGRPRFHDVPAKTTLSAREKTIIWLTPKPAAAKTAEGAGSGSFDIEALVALGDVHLTSPGKTQIARDRLDAVFVADPGLAIAAPAPAPVANPGARANPVADAKPSAPKPGAPDRPAEPEAKAIANKVFARLLLRPAAAGAASTGSATLGGGPGASRNAEIDRVYLRGNVAYHQDPAPGKPEGTDVTGEAIDLINQGNDPATKAARGTRFIVYHKDLAAADDDGLPLAMVKTDEMTIRGKVIGLDQATDEAWVDGRGSLTQMAARGLFSDKGLTNPPADAKPTRPAKATAEVKKAPMTVAFARGMKFFGQSTNPKGKPAARAEFYQDVHAYNEDSSVDCDEVMKTYFDRTVKLARPPREKKARGEPGSPEPAEPKADIALIECFKNVVVVNVKVDPNSKKDVLEKQRVMGDYLAYHKATGNFLITGEGEVHLYEREGQGGANGLSPGGPATIRPASGPAPGHGPSARRATAVVGRNSTRNPADLSADRPRARGPKRPLPPLVLTQIHFTQEMRGRFGSGKDADKTEPRYADFFGDVEALRARVADSASVLDRDDRPEDAVFMTSQVLRVVSEPSTPTRANPEPPPRHLLRAWENAFAATEDKTIQADTITYNSATNLFYAYGEEGRDISIVQQDQVGQPFSGLAGRTVMYNAKTGQSNLVDPSGMAAIDKRTGYRPSAAKPTEKTIKRTPRIQFRNLRGNIERKDFSGR